MAAQFGKSDLKSLILSIDQKIENYCKSCVVPIEGTSKSIYTPPTPSEMIKNLIKLRQVAVSRLREHGESPFESFIKSVQKEKNDKEKEILSQIAARIEDEIIPHCEIATVIVTAISTGDYTALKEHEITEHDAIIISQIIKKMKEHKKNKVVMKVLAEISRATIRKH